jgi:hypothetical protein
MDERFQPRLHGFGRVRRRISVRSSGSSGDCICHGWSTWGNSEQLQVHLEEVLG